MSTKLEENPVFALRANPPLNTALGSMMKDWLAVPPFQPRASSPTFVIWADFFMLPAYALWVVGGGLVTLAFRGYPAAALLLVPWVALLVALSKWLHREGRARLNISLGAAAFVLAMAMFVCLWF